MIKHDKQPIKNVKNFNSKNFNIARNPLPLAAYFKVTMFALTVLSYILID
ncbi:hypothetical protein [Pseudoalteromonas sp.]